MAQFTMETNVSVPMRDGVLLAADVYRPALPGRYPVLLQRTAYDKSSQMTSTMLNPLRAAKDGFVVVVQDCRGRYASDGEWTPFFCEIEDGYDTVEWCSEQAWSNGDVGMYGMSYVGATQWLAAISSPPHLRCIFPVMTASDYHDGWIYIGGAFNLGFTAAWTAQFLAAPHLASLGLSEEERAAAEAELLGAVTRLRRHVSGFPLAELPMLARNGLAPYFFEWLRHPAYDDYWKTIDITAHHDQITVPAFNFGGWHDLFIAGPPRNFAGLRTGAANPEARDGQRLIIGPWTHNSPTVTTAGDKNFGPIASVDLEKLQLRWFNHWLRGMDDGLMAEAPVRIFVMNDGWRDEAEWPLARAQYTPMYLHSSGRANSMHGDGTLTTQSPATERPDVFLFNPNVPTGAVGGGGVWDQRPAEERTDVLVYTTAPLKEPLEVTGPVELVLWVSSSVPDTDFTAKLVDVRPDGYAENVCDGILRASYRESRESAVALIPGQPTEMRIDMLVTSTLFRAGHRLRLEISSSCFPKFDRNPNTGEPAASARNPVVALQSVLHDPTHPTHLILPVIPRPGTR